MYFVRYWVKRCTFSHVRIGSSLRGCHWPITAHLPPNKPWSFQGWPAGLEMNLRKTKNMSALMQLFLSWQTIQDQAAVVIVFRTWNFPRVCICLEMSADNQLGTWTLSRQSQLAHGTSPEASTFHFQFLTYSSTWSSGWCCDVNQAWSQERNENERLLFHNPQFFLNIVDNFAHFPRVW